LKSSIDAIKSQQLRSELAVFALAIHRQDAVVSVDNTQQRLLDDVTVEPFATDTAAKVEVFVPVIRWREDPRPHRILQAR